MDKPILIIGAGAAGLAAARKLDAAGLRTIVLEARNRVGGRIHTLHASWPTPIEAGPEFIHGQSPELEQLLESAGVTTEELPDRHYRFTGSRPHRMDFDHAWDEILKQLEKHSGPDQSFAEFLNQRCPRLSSEDRTMAIEYVEGFNAADSRQISVQWLRKTEAELGAGGDEVIRRLTSGYDQVPQALLREGTATDIRLNCSVKAIRWRRGEVDVEASENGNRSAEYRAERAIVTLPLGILQASPHHGGVRFIPELPAKRAAAQRLIMGAIVKLALWFREPFWADLGITDRGFLHVPQSRFMTWWPLGDSLVLTGWSGGPRAEQLSMQSDAAILETAISDLARGLELDARRVQDLLVEGRAFNWQTDPLARGAYSYAAVGGAQAAHELAAPVEDTLFFAGEATDDEYPATVAGAIRSGYRAADEVLRSSR